MTAGDLRHGSEALEAAMISLLNGKPGRCFESVAVSFCLLPSSVGFFNENLVSDWSSSDKTSSAGEARRVSAGSANQFQQFVTPGTGRKFTELYNVQHLTSNHLDPVARVTICAIQRLYAILRGFFFLLNERMPLDQFTRGDRQRSVRVQRSVWITSASLLDLS